MNFSSNVLSLAVLPKTVGLFIMEEFSMKDLESTNMYSRLVPTRVGGLQLIINILNKQKDTQMNECLRKKEMFEQAQLVLEFSSPRRIYILAQHDTDDYCKRHTESAHETKRFL